MTKGEDRYDESRLIEDELAELAAGVPEEAWDGVPNDLLDRLDYYLYDEQDDDGSKRNPGQVQARTPQTPAQDTSAG